MLNAVWIAMVLGALVSGALNGTMAEVAKASSDAAGTGVELAIGLVGVMTLWIGLMKVMQDGGMLRMLARGLRGPMRWLFPDVPADHPAMSMMILNMSSNMLGLANAATPFGIKAMLELNKLNDRPGVATNSMALFLAINTSNVALLPTGIIALRASLGSTSPGSILVTTLLATVASTAVAIGAAKLFQRFSVFAAPPAVAGLQVSESESAVNTNQLQSELGLEDDVTAPSRSLAERLLLFGVLTVVVSCLVVAGVQRAGEIGWISALREIAEQWTLVLLIGGIVCFGWYRGVSVYDSVVEGGKEGFGVALRIIPFLVAILVAVSMLRASGGLDLVISAIAPVAGFIGFPAESLPMALLRSLSGSGAYGVAAEIMKVHGPDSLVGQIVSTMQGSTETTFYVLAVYYGAASISRARHTLAACLTADIAGLIAAVWACRWLLS